MPPRRFLRATQVDRSSDGIDFAAFSILPDSEKERLCRKLLAEFGVTKVQVDTERGEMIHSCCLPLGGHRNGDSNPSASLNFRKLTYNCLGCGNSGGLLWFIAVCRNETSQDSREWLKQTTGVGDDTNLGALLEYFEAVYSQKVETVAPLPNFSPKVLEPWLKIHGYLTEDRHIPEPVLERFKVGFNPAYTVKVGDDWVKSQRIILPHFWKDRLVGWQSRRLFKSDGTPKYVSSPDFPKDTTLFNYDARRAAVVVESMMSVLARYQQCPIMEATFGAKVTDRQIWLLAQHPKVYLFFDNDDAGWAATNRCIEGLRDHTDVRVVDNPYDADPADLDKDTFGEVMARAVPWDIWNRPKKLEPWDH